MHRERFLFGAPWGPPKPSSTTRMGRDVAILIKVISETILEQLNRRHEFNAYREGKLLITLRPPGVEPAPYTPRRVSFQQQKTARSCCQEGTSFLAS